MCTKTFTKNLAQPLNLVFDVVTAGAVDGCIEQHAVLLQKLTLDL